MPISNLQSYIAYFQNIAAQHTMLRGAFIYGGVDLVLEGQRSNAQYPLLWLEPASINIIDDEVGLRAIYDTSFIVLTNAATDDWQGAKIQNESAHDIGLQIIEYLKVRNGIDFYKLDINTIGTESIGIVGVDGAIARRFFFKLQADSDICADCADCGGLEQWFDLSKTSNGVLYQPATLAPAKTISTATEFYIHANNDLRTLTFSYPHSIGDNVQWSIAASGNVIATSTDFSLTFKPNLPLNTLLTVAFTRNGNTAQKSFILNSFFW